MAHELVGGVGKVVQAVLHLVETAPERVLVLNLVSDLNEFIQRAPDRVEAVAEALLRQQSDDVTVTGPVVLREDPLSLLLDHELDLNVEFSLDVVGEVDHQLFVLISQLV